MEGDLMLKTKSKDLTSIVSDEERWNKRAESFNQSYLKEKSALPKWITDYLIDSKKLSGAQILDVGGGIGRYAFLFAKAVKKVFLTDVALNMLDFAKENQRALGLYNLEYAHMNWKEDSIEDFGFNKVFDLVFASMCPAVRTREGIKKMIKASKKWCSINQFICFEDTFSTYLWDEYGIKRPKDPHQDKEIVIDIVNYLWSKNYTPEIHYFEEITETEITKEEMLELGRHKYNDLLKTHSLSIEEVTEKIAVDGIIKNRIRKKTALITWCIE